jgi:inhibitor of KinA
MSMQITPLGDSALIVRLAESFEGAPEETLKAVLAAQGRLETAQLPGVIEIAPAYTTVAVFFDPARVVNEGAQIENVFGWFEQRIHAALKSVEARVLTREPETAAEDSRHYSRLIEIAVCYEAEFALDLEDVARHAGVHWKEVVDLHCSGEYRVHCVGFTPGFPFLGGLPGKLATPRRAIPRKEIPAGSVAIGGAQTGIYPLKSPGGWNVIGRTPLRLFDPEKNPPALLRAGDHVRFRSITREEFERKMKC